MSDKVTMIAQEGSDSRVATLCALYSIRDGDIAAIQSYGNIVVPKWDEFVALFYDWLKKQPAFEVFSRMMKPWPMCTACPAATGRLFFAMIAMENILQNGIRFGETHARIGLPLTIYIAAMQDALSDVFRRRGLKVDGGT